MAEASVTAVNLVRGEFVVVDAAGIDSISVAAGEIWLTREGDIEDHFVSAGHAMRLEDRRGPVFMQARAATVLYLCAARPARTAGRLVRLLGAAAPASRAGLPA